MAQERDSLMKRFAEELRGQEERLEASISDTGVAGDAVQALKARLTRIRQRFGELEQVVEGRLEDMMHELHIELSGIEQSINEWARADEERQKKD
ncbi:MAG: hypothetical protein ACOY99_03305 [Pseudomonadota bacterium]|jgi:chromosome segregation ATPase